MPEYEEPKLLKNINYKDRNLVNKELKKIEINDIKESVETACVITEVREIYKCFGFKDRVFLGCDLGDKLKGASVSNNHPIDETSYSFTRDATQIDE